MLALPAATGPAALLAWFSTPDICPDDGIVTAYNNGRFVGQQQTLLDCGPKRLRVVDVAARPLDNSFTMFIQVAQARQTTHN